MLRQIMKLVWSKLVEVWSNAQKPYIQLYLPTKGFFYCQEQQLKQIALQEAVRLRPIRPLYNPEDLWILEEYKQLESQHPTEFNSDQMYQELLAEREIAQVLEAQATMGEWWQIASETERQQWLNKARKLQQQRGS